MILHLGHVDLKKLNWIKRHTNWIREYFHFLFALHTDGTLMIVDVKKNLWRKKSPTLLPPVDSFNLWPQWCSVLDSVIYWLVGSFRSNHHLMLMICISFDLLSDFFCWVLWRILFCILFVNFTCHLSNHRRT